MAKSIVKQAEEIINTHNYKLCLQCPKRCKVACVAIQILADIVNTDTVEEEREIIDGITPLLHDHKDI